MDKLFWYVAIAFITEIGFSSGCSKSTNVAPTLQYTGVNSTTVPVSSTLQFNFTASNIGSSTDSIFFFSIVRNCPNALSGSLTSAVVGLPVPSFSSIGTPTLSLCFANGTNSTNTACTTLPNIQTTSGRNCSSLNRDTVVYRFWIKNSAKLLSDTVNSDKIIVYHQ